MKTIGRTALIFLLVVLSGPAFSQPGPEAQGIKGLKRRAKFGDVDSQYELGVAYAQGKGVTKNLAQAAKLYRKAAEAGHLAGQVRLADALREGQGVALDASEAFSWYQMAAERRFAPAEHSLAIAYLRGQGVETDKPEGVRRLEDLAEQSFAPSMIALAECYQTGEGVERSPERARTLLKEAAETGHAESRYLYAVLLRESGNENEKRQASVVLAQVAKEGYQPAIKYLNRLKRSGKISKKAPPPVSSKFTRIPMLIVIVVCTLFVLFVKRNELDFRLPHQLRKAVSLPGVLRGPDFQIDIRVKGEENLSGVLLYERKKVRVVLEGDLTPEFWLRGLLGKFSDAYREPNISVLEKIEQGSLSGDPITLVPSGDLYRAKFSFDFGLSLDTFFLTFCRKKRLLKVCDECTTTVWDS